MKTTKKQSQTKPIKANFTYPKGVEQISGAGWKNNRSEYLFINRMMQKIILFSDIPPLLGYFKALKSRY